MRRNIEWLSDIVCMTAYVCYAMDICCLIDGPLMYTEYGPSMGPM